ncbi:hypothetical protein PINS_up024194 [Pythium insidiosum]|nr:hypothetical protein PINS_up024194 [Pythium insidiosum]
MQDADGPSPWRNKHVKIVRACLNNGRIQFFLIGCHRHLQHHASFQLQIQLQLQLQLQSRGLPWSLSVTVVLYQILTHLFRRLHSRPGLRLDVGEYPGSFFTVNVRLVPIVA